MSVRKIAAASIVAAVAFALYYTTLLPGLDFGDTGSFQTTVGSAIITPRDGYPLYFAIGDLFLHVTGEEPARALNLASAVEGAVACGLLVLAAAELSRSVAAAIAAALLFAGSYTFWSQAIIAEVYALHLVFVTLTLRLLLRWEARPMIGRLALFFAAYALGFGNHLSMVLLAPAYTLFLLVSAPGGWRSMLKPRVVLVALVLASAGALQYAWNLRALWLGPSPPSGLLAALRTFWFDVTKSDWRETMVMQVPEVMLRDRTSMYLFDLHQQFGWVGPLLAVLGLGRIAAASWRRGVLMLVLYLVNALFAYTYNVGDVHVFYLPSHLIVAMLAAPGIVLVGEIVGRLAAFSDRRIRDASVVAVAVIVASYAGWRIHRDYPALDRSADRRPAEVLAAMTAGLDDSQSILLTDLNWQIQNGLSYFGKVTRPDLASARAPDVLLYAPALVRDNAAIGRRVALTERAAHELAAAYGPLFRIERDPRAGIPAATGLVAGLPPGTRYVLCLLKPTREFTLDPADFARAGSLLAGRPLTMPDGDYSVVAGITGRAPALLVSANTPFDRRVILDGTPVDVRMESWLATDTIRRMGFGHVVAARHHALIVERGVSFVAFDAEGRPMRSGYAAGIFAPQPRFVIVD